MHYYSYQRQGSIVLASDDREKLLDHGAGSPKRRSGTLACGIAACAGAASLWMVISAWNSSGSLASIPQIADYASFSPSPQCPVQPDPIIPALPFDVPTSFRIEAATRLSQAVQVPSINYDDSGLVTEDVRSHDLARQMRLVGTSIR